MRVAPMPTSSIPARARALSPSAKCARYKRA
jgi:hypothetical protein